MKKLLSIFLCFILCVNVCFADTEEEMEARSPFKLIAGIAMTLIGGFLIYDGFSKVEEDISKPSVNYAGAMSAFFTQNEEGGEYTYTLYTGEGNSHKIGRDPEYIHLASNEIYNNGNVDLTNVQVMVRYRYSNHNPINDVTLNHGTTPITEKDREGYFVASGSPNKIDLAQNEKASWTDKTNYTTTTKNAPYPGNDYDNDVLFQEESLNLVDVKVTYNYKKKYKTKNKSDIEGVAGIAIAGAGIYFIVDYFVQLNKFNQYAKRNDLNIRLAKQPNEYKLLLSKRI